MSFLTKIMQSMGLREKLNPAQEVIYTQEGTNVNTTANVSYLTAFKTLESVHRGVSMVVGACASLDYDIKEKTHDGTYPGFRIKSLNTLLNQRPNPYQSTQEFRTNIFTDFLLEGNVFLYYDGAFLYHLPAAEVVIEPDEKTFVKGYTYNSQTPFDPYEIAHFKDLSGTSIYRGTSRLQAAQRNINILYKMQNFQETFFDNGAIPGFALGTENTLSQIAKDKTVANWMKNYSPKNGSRKPIIIDSGLKPLQLMTTTFKEMDFDISINRHNVKILETIGVPPVLLDGGNQANISPNLRLFYLETVLPIIRKFSSSLELMTGYNIDAVTSNVSALQPDLKDIAAYHVGLVNGGIITANEARTELRYEKDKDPESDKLRVPANIAGSAVQPNIGGAPKKPKPE
jgi:HK97 family phage portal protein